MIELVYPSPQEAESYYRILHEGKFSYYYGSLSPSVDSERQWIQRRKTKRDQDLEYNYSVYYQGQHVGGCHLKRNPEYSHIGELGYFIDKDYFNRGICSQVVAYLEDLARDKNFKRLEIRMDPRNKASERVAIKNNYKLEGCMECALFFQGTYYDNLIYSKILEDQ